MVVLRFPYNCLYLILINFPVFSHVHTEKSFRRCWRWQWRTGHHQGRYYHTQSFNHHCTQQSSKETKRETTWGSSAHGIDCRTESSDGWHQQRSEVEGRGIVDGPTRTSGLWWRPCKHIIIFLHFLFRPISLKVKP